MVQRGLVVEATEKTATVEIERSHACSGCGACRLRGGKIVVEVENLCNAKAGDLVAVQMDGGSFLKVAAIMYAIPLAAFLLGVVLGALHSVAASAVGGAVLLAVAAVCIRLNEKRWRKLRFSPAAVEVVSANSETLRE